MPVRLAANVDPLHLTRGHHIDRDHAVSRPVRDIDTPAGGVTNEMMRLAADAYTVRHAAGADLHQPNLATGDVRQDNQGTGVGGAACTGAEQERSKSNDDGGRSFGATQHHCLPLSGDAPQRSSVYHML